MKISTGRNELCKCANVKTLIPPGTISEMANKKIQVARISNNLEKGKGYG